MAVKFHTPINNAQAKLTAAHVVGDNALVVDVSSVFGSPTTNNPVRVTVIRLSDQANAIYSITNVNNSTHTLTIDAVLEGMTDIAFAVNDLVGVEITAGTVSDIHDAINEKAPLVAPALTGVPTAPTASAGTNTTQIATTAFVLANAGGVPAGSDGQIQYNSSSVFAGSSSLTWSQTNHQLAVQGGIHVSLNNSDFDNINGDNSHILIDNASGSQNVISSYIGGNLVAKWRTDAAGNINWVAAGGYQAFYTGGDYPSGTAKFYIDNNGRVRIANGAISTTVAQLAVHLSSPSIPGIIIIGAVSQTVNLQEWQNSNGTAVAKVKPSGVVTAPGFATALSTKTTTYTITLSDCTIIADASTSSFALTLPAANTVEAGRLFVVKKVDSSANSVALSASGSDKIDGATSVALSVQYSSLTVQCDGVSNWWII